ncbi:D-ribose-binding periplasmic protein [Trifolium repens]|nr:D-ribose-binding periplasmic protein [Trifolium repens]
MGNCQAIDAAALVIQHPSGKIERLYWSVSASYVMRANPGHYVSLIMPLPQEQEGHNSNNNEVKKAVLFTRVKLLKPEDTLTLGHAYRLITTQEVERVLRVRKRRTHGKTVEGVEMVEMEKENSVCESEGMLDTGKMYQAMRADRRRLKVASTNPAAPRLKSWRPSLQSISEFSN